MGMDYLSTNVLADLGVDIAIQGLTRRSHPTFSKISRARPMSSIPVAAYAYKDTSSSEIERQSATANADTVATIKDLETYHEV